ncbi:MAG: ferrochelatase [Draconibacterium sp.]|nr:ferrochelatase [Draconibacterium sp.]
MTKAKTAILLMNIGSPDRATRKSVRQFLTVFLNDKRVIDLPWALRKLLVNLIIIPFRVKKSTQMYQRLFNEKGSPLIYHSEELKEKLQEKLGGNFEVFLGMRYGNPGYKQALREINSRGFQQIILFPLFPQHAMSTTTTAIVAAKDEIKRQNIESQIFEIEQFYNHPKFIQAIVNQTKKYDLNKFDHVLFSFHGLPDRHIKNIHPEIKIEHCNCSDSVPEHGKYCYRATCFATARLIASKLGKNLPEYSVAFQSRLSKNWLSPFSDEVLLRELREGNKNILVIAPSFVTDCLETVIEIGEDYRNNFIDNGGERLVLVDNLNAENSWVESLNTIILEFIQSKKQKT